MANILVNSESIQAFNDSVTKKGNDLGGEFWKLHKNLLEDAKSVIKSNNGSLEYIDQMIKDIRDLHTGFVEFLRDFENTLFDMVDNYQNVDQGTTQNVSMLEGATMAMSVGAGGLAASGFDFSKISGTAGDVVSGNFINESKVNNSSFGEGEYTFMYREDGTVRVDKDGVPMAYTTRENADKITGGIKDTTDTIKTTTDTNKNNAEPIVAAGANDESKGEANSGSASSGGTDVNNTNNITEEAKTSDEVKADVNTETVASDNGASSTNNFAELGNQVKNEREQDALNYGDGPWADISISKKKALAGFNKDNPIVQQTTYREGGNTRTMVVLASGEYVVVPGGKVDSVGFLNTTLLNPLSPEKANSMLTYETRKKIYEYTQNK